MTHYYIPCAGVVASGRPAVDMIKLDTHFPSKTHAYTFSRPFPSRHPGTDDDDDDDVRACRVTCHVICHALAEMEGVPRLGGGLAVADEADHWATVRHSLVRCWCRSL